MVKKFTVTVPAEARERTEAYDAVEVLGLSDDGSYRITSHRTGVEGCDLRDSGCIFIPKG